jgi:hypothetical protein
VRERRWGNGVVPGRVEGAHASRRRKAAVETRTGRGRGRVGRGVCRDWREEGGREREWRVGDGRCSGDGPGVEVLAEWWIRRRNSGDAGSESNE